MSINIMIGIGGTGAKVAEAIVQATAAGLGPDRLEVGFVDQDRTNGNTSRTRRLIGRYGEARRAWQSPGGAHKIEGAPLAAEIQFFSGDGLWTPHSDRSVKFSSIFGHLGPDERLFDMLYLDGDVEKHLELEGGYRSRPHIGSAAITEAADAKRGGFWTDLETLINRAAGGEEVRILLCGSMFGGTGAAGLPTVARLIREAARKETKSENLRLGAVLMLPYFGFDPPPIDAKGRAANVARADELLTQSRGALRYYHSMFREQRLFDDFYLVGWNRPFMFRYHSAEKDDQTNPALLPELVAAMGGCRFFSRASGDFIGDVNVCARAADAAFDWADLPAIGPNSGDAAMESFGQMLRFAVAWKHYRPIISKRPPRLFGRQDYQSMQNLRAVDYTDTATEAALTAMDRYIDELFRWAVSIQAYAQDNQMEFGLWSLDPLVSAMNLDKPNKQVEIVPEIGSNDAFVAAYNDTLRLPSGTMPAQGARDLFSFLSERRAGNNHQGLGQMVASLFAAAAPRSGA